MATLLAFIIQENSSLNNKILDPCWKLNTPFYTIFVMPQSVELHFT